MRDPFVHPPTGQVQQHAADLVEVLDAFDPGTALIDVERRRLGWCSPTFIARCGLHPGASEELADHRLPGLATALRQGLPRKRWRVRSGVFKGQALQVVAVRPGLAALRMLDRADGPDDPAQVQAVQRHLEDRERLLFTSRTLSVSEMASALAHELNQPIGTVVNVLRGIRARLERAAEAGPDGASAYATARALEAGVHLALDQAQFATRIVARIRDFTHARQPRTDALALDRVVADAMSLMDWELRRDQIECALDCGNGPWPVVGDETMLQQVCVNLMRNAIEAMRGGPRRRLDVSIRPDASGRAVELAIRDSGCGLPADAEQRLFVPFQSTKPNGMGLGLNICRSFIELHQGQLWFSRHDDNGAGQQGSTFHVCLPLAVPPRLVGDEAAQACASPSAGPFADTTADPFVDSARSALDDARLDDDR